MKSGKTVKVLVVEPSESERRAVARALARQDGLDVVGVAADAYTARDLIVYRKPDVLWLALTLPRMSGREFMGVLRKFWPMPVIAVGENLTGQPGLKQELTMLGAAAVFERPATGAAELVTPAAKIIQNLSPEHGSQAGDCCVIAIGASTGGTEAILEVLQRLPNTIPGLLIVQHMPHHFTQRFAQRLDRLCPTLTVREAAGGELVRPGMAFIAPGDRHLVLKREGGRYLTQLQDGAPICRHRPSVDALFQSVAREARERAVGVLLTGMGNDGAAGLLAMRRAGARTLTQDRETSAVYGMPREALTGGGAERAVPLNQMAQQITQLVAWMARRTPVA